MSVYVSTKVRLIAEFRDFDLTLADPDVVTCTLDGVALTTVRDAIGKYHADFIPTTAGRKIHVWTGSGSVQAHSEGSIEIYGHLT